VTGDFNLTNHEPVVMGSLLAELFERLGLPPAGRDVPLAKAMRIARIVEWAYRTFAPSKEPPITRYGVGVLAWSKTFDPEKCRRVLGPPSVPLRDGIERFIEWEKERRADGGGGDFAVR
jgi:nucleoside-diphosphate-sugar epimerase